MYTGAFHCHNLGHDGLQVMCSCIAGKRAKEEFWKDVEKIKRKNFLWFKLKFCLLFYVNQRFIWVLLWYYFSGLYKIHPSPDSLLCFDCFTWTTSIKSPLKYSKNTAFKKCLFFIVMNWQIDSSIKPLAFLFFQLLYTIKSCTKKWHTQNKLEGRTTGCCSQCCQRKTDHFGTCEAEVLSEPNWRSDTFSLQKRKWTVLCLYKPVKSQIQSFRADHH